MKIKLLTTNNEIEAKLIQGRLKEEGIRSYSMTSNQNYDPGIFGINSGMVPYDIFVAEEDLEKAKEIIQKRL